MTGYIIKRILISIPVIIGITVITFFLLNVVPGDPVVLMMKEHISPDVVERVKAEMHLNDPVYLRYIKYMWGALHGDLGRSYKLNREVADLIVDAFPNTLKLSVAAVLIAWIVGIPAGIVSAVKQYSFIDNFFMGFALLGVSMPVFWSALIMQYIFALKLGLLPVSGFAGPQYIIMPAIVLGWSSAASIARLTRSSLLEVIRTDYIRTARAKGLREWQVVFYHALKNSMLPVVTIMAIQIASLLSGAVITESVFGIPGIGRLSVNAIQNRDMPLLQGTLIFTVVLVILGNLFADIAYSYLDPRIKYE
ncbi:ABC transporter permease [Biomaibacter acetigenes]|uniref:ABC transporter permease n=1 Tax=Biomaibacter acetigenes TaxID=2316383 RepID=A0A3G2R2Q9_9FIRM|nr:ABC transporter permease [Biomaibacter acetigenes]AYO29786.1 ABC transporter permease [Biomaibacter acetigenes]